uniref:Uncharacterized protein n=1 Tax=Rhizophora mucronata TaxID=61149 RepID=A0A2P2Q1A0_RHIMU
MYNRRVISFSFSFINFSTIYTAASSIFKGGLARLLCGVLYYLLCS